MGKWHYTRDGNGGWFKKWEDDSPSNGGGSFFGDGIFSEILYFVLSCVIFLPIGLLVIVPIACIVLLHLCPNLPSTIMHPSQAQEKKSNAAKNMAKWYTPEADIVVGQKFFICYIDYKSGAIIPKYKVFFGKAGLNKGRL